MRTMKHEYKQRGGVLLGCAVIAAAALLAIVIVGILFVMWLKAAGIIPPSDAFLRRDCRAYAIVTLDPAEKGVLSLLQKIETEVNSKLAETGDKQEGMLSGFAARNPVSSLKQYMPLQVVACETPSEDGSVVTIILSLSRGKGMMKLIQWSLRKSSKAADSEVTMDTYKGCELFLMGKRGDQEEDQGLKYTCITGTTVILSGLREPVERALDAVQSPPTEYCGPTSMKQQFLAVEGKGQICGVGTGDSQTVKHFLHSTETSSEPLFSQDDLVAWHVSIISADTLRVGGEVVCANESAATLAAERVREWLGIATDRGRVSSQTILSEGTSVRFGFDMIGIESVIEQWFTEREDEDAPAKTGIGNG